MDVDRGEACGAIGFNGRGPTANARDPAPPGGLAARRVARPRRIA